MVRNSQKMFRLMEKASENGGVDVKEGKEIYSSRQSFYSACENLEDRDLFSRKKAPLYSSVKYIWVLTEKGKDKLEQKEISEEH